MAEKKEFNRTFIASMKNIAKSISSSVKERDKLEREIAERQARIAEIDQDITESEAIVRRKTGYGVMDLIKRDVIDTGKVDKNGKPIKVTQYNLIYPETIVPTTPIGEDAEQVDDLPFMTEDVINPSNEI